MIAVWAFALTATVSWISDQAWVDRTIAGDAELPSLFSVQDAAERALDLASDDEVAGWASRARWRGIVPQIHASIGTDANFDVRDSLTARVLRTTTDRQGFGFDVGARWRLGELVFSENELRAHQQCLARAKAINEAREKVTQLYFERLKLLSDERVWPSPDLRLKAKRLEGLIDAYTGGKIEWKNR